MAPLAEIERRCFDVENLRATADEETKTPRIEGYAAVFNKLSVDLGGFREKIAYGAFAETLDDDVRALFNHDVNYVLGRTVNDTLELRENRLGLKVKITPPGTQWANDLVVSINRGDISQMSFGFSVIDDVWETKAGENIRTIQKVKLYDVSPVTFPAYPQTKVTARSIDLSATRALALRIDHGLPITEEDRKFIQQIVRLGALREIVDDSELNETDRLELYARLISGAEAQGSPGREEEEARARSSLSLRAKELDLAIEEGKLS